MTLEQMRKQLHEQARSARDETVEMYQRVQRMLDEPHSNATLTPTPD